MYSLFHFLFYFPCGDFYFCRSLSISWHPFPISLLFTTSLCLPTLLFPPPSTYEPAHGPSSLLPCLPFADPPGILSIAFLLECSTASFPHLPSGGSVLLLHFPLILPIALAFPPCHPVGVARQAVFGLGAYRVIPQPHGENLRDQGGFFHAGDDSVVDL